MLKQVQHDAPLSLTNTNNMKRLNPYYVLQQYYVDFLKAGDEYRIVLCETDGQRERMIAQAEIPVQGWMAMHMTKTADDMHYYCTRYLPNETIADETGDVLMKATG